MIRKYLIYGDHIFLTSYKKEISEEKYQILDVLLPLEIYWDVESMLRKLNYMVSSHEDRLNVLHTHKNLFKKLAPYAKNEKDRAWLYAKSQGLKPEEIS